MESLAHHRALLGSSPQLAVACCLTYAEGVGHAELARRMGGTDAATGQMSYLDAAQEAAAGAPQFVLADIAGAGWALALEPYGYQGSRAEVLRAVSAGGRAVSVYWNVNARLQLAYARDGQVLARADAQHRWGPEAGQLEPHLAGLDLATDGAAAALAAAERITGVRVDTGWLTAEHPSFWITPLPSDLIPAGHEDHPALADAELRAVLTAPGPAALPVITTLAAELVVRHSGLDDEPVAAEVLAALRGGPRRADLAGDVTALAEEYARRRQTAEAAGAAGSADADRWFYRGHAVRALEGALDPDPAKAAWTVCWLAGNAVGGNFGDQLRLAVLSRLVDRATGAR